MAVLMFVALPGLKIRFEHKIILAYLVIGCIWILFSDKLVSIMLDDPHVITRIQTLKGWFYVVITGILFFLLLRHHLEKLRAAEQKARESDMLKTIFIQNISHEIRTPMNGIIGFTELLKDKKVSGQEREEYFRIISESSTQLFSIISEVLDISLIESGVQKVNMNSVSLRELINDIYFLYSPLIKEGISFNTISDKVCDNEQVLTDEFKVKQILRNLLDNSLKFVEKGYIRFGYIKKESEIEFFVEDSGIGIRKELQEKVFERFTKDETITTRFYNGIGLGLAISKGLVELLGGRIWLNSEPGKGSRFTFTIPYLKPEENSAKKIGIKELDNESFSGIKVLVAEDNIPNRKYLMELLSRMGFKVLVASDGREALNTFRQHPDIEIVILDLKMPVMDGYEVLKEIRKTNQTVHIIAQTAYSVNDRERVLLEGFNDYIPKPFKAEQLNEAIVKYTRSGKVIV